MQCNLERLRKFGHKDVLGLDIGSHAVKMVQLSRNGDGYTVNAAGIAACKSDNDAGAVNAVRDCLEVSGIGAQLAVCSISGPEVAARGFKFPSLLPEEVAGAVQFEAAQICPFNVDDAAVEYQLIHNDNEPVQGILVAATNSVIERKKMLVKNAHLDCCLMDIDGLALLNCFNELEKPRTSDTIAILNIGAVFTNLAIQGSGSPPFIRDMAFGGNDIIKFIAQEKGVAENVVTAKLFASEDFSDSLENACKTLVVDIKESMRYYKTQEKSGPVEKVFVCGGFARTRGMVEMLNNSLNTAIILWNPFEEIDCQVDSNCLDVLKEQGPAMAIAAGLAMRSV